MKRYDIPTTWFHPRPHARDLSEGMRGPVIAAGHEVGHHGWTHQPPATLTREQEEGRAWWRANAVIKEDDRQGRAPAIARRPWDLSAHTIDLLLKHGFVYDTSMMGDDYTPYFARQGRCHRAGEAGGAGQRVDAGRAADLVVARRLSAFRVSCARRRPSCPACRNAPGACCRTGSTTSPT